MTTSSIFAVFEDFNEPRDEPVAVPPEDEPVPFSEIGEIKSAAWTEGYIAGRQECGVNLDQAITAKLLTSVHELASTTTTTVDAAALLVADLMAQTVIAVTSEAWSARLLERVGLVVDRVRPALTVAPEFVLRDDDGLISHFADISELSRAVEAGSTGADVTIRWHRGEATISRMALLEDLREAFIPLSAGRVNDQTARNQT